MNQMNANNNNNNNNILCSLFSIDLVYWWINQFLQSIGWIPFRTICPWDMYWICVCGKLLPSPSPFLFFFGVQSSQYQENVFVYIYFIYCFIHIYLPLYVKTLHRENKRVTWKERKGKIFFLLGYIYMGGRKKDKSKINVKIYMGGRKKNNNKRK